MFTQLGAGLPGHQHIGQQINIQIDNATTQLDQTVPNILNQVLGSLGGLGNGLIPGQNTGLDNVLQ